MTLATLVADLKVETDSRTATVPGDVSLPGWPVFADST